MPLKGLVDATEGSEGGDILTPACTELHDHSRHLDDLLIDEVHELQTRPCFGTEKDAYVVDTLRRGIGHCSMRLAMTSLRSLSSAEAKFWVLKLLMKEIQRFGDHTISECPSMKKLPYSVRCLRCIVSLPSLSRCSR